MVPVQIPLDIPVTAEDFNKVNWQEVITGLEESMWYDYANAFSGKMIEAQSAKDKSAEGVFALLTLVTSFRPNFENRDQPFGPYYSNNSMPSPRVKDLTVNHICALRAIAPKVSNPDLRARICDVIWCCKRQGNADMAAVAVTAYIEASELPVKYEHQTIDKLNRATQLGYQLGKSSDVYKSVIAYLEKRLARIDGADDGVLSLHLMKFLQQQGEGDPAVYVALCDKLIAHPRKEQFWAVKRQYIECKADWLHIAKQLGEEQTARKEAAETYVSEAESEWSSGEPGLQGNALWNLRTSIEAFRQLGMKDRADELHARYLEWQKVSVYDNMFHVESEPIDIQECVSQAKGAVKGKSVFEALLTLASIEHPPKVSELHESAEEALSNAPFYALASKVAKSVDGRDTALGPSYLSSDPVVRDAAVRIEMFTQATRLQELIVVACVEPARQQILGEHNVWPEDLLPIVHHNPFVPFQHEYTFVRGIYAGLIGEFDIAVALLVPLIENALRYILQQAGLVVTSLESGREATQDVYDLGKLFSGDSKYRAKLVDIYGEDAIFDLEGLLEERWGTNLRNRLAHGLMTDYDYHSSSAIYAWWWALRLCCLPILASIQRKSQQQVTNG